MIILRFAHMEKNRVEKIGNLGQYETTQKDFPMFSDGCLVLCH